MTLPRILFFTSVLFLTACGRLGFAGPEPTATPAVLAVPTFTPTVETASAAAPASTPVAAAPVAEADESVVAVDDVQERGEDQGSEEQGDEEEVGSAVLLPTPTPEDDAAASATDSAETTESAAPAAAEPAPQETGPTLTVTGDLVNVRQGPGTEYDIVGSAAAGDAYAVLGRNDAADWWQVCCFGGETEEPGWLYGPLVEVSDGDAVAIVAEIPPAPTAAPAAEEPAAAEPVAAEPAAEAAPEEAAAPLDPVAEAHSGTAGVFDPAAQYHIVGYRIIGYGENNGGIFNNGGQHMIFINVIDAAGNGVDGAVVKNAIDDNVNIVTGPKGPGRAEFEMFWDPYKLYVASDPSGPVTSQVTNQMNTAHPHIPDIIGRLGPPEEEYAICPTPDDRCEPPFYHAHWSYEVTFQKVN